MNRLRPIDFRELRRQLKPKTVLLAIGWRPLFERGNLSRGPCPFHGSRTPHSRSLCVTHEVARCFKCGWFGDAVAIWAHVKRLPPLEAAYELAATHNIPLVYLS